MADEKLKARLGLDNSEFKRGLKDSESQLSSMNAGFKRLGVMIGAAFSVSAISNFVGEGIKLAASMQGVETAFKNLNQPNLLQNLRNATRGTVTDLQLMQKAVQAKNFKIPLEQLATYFEFATKRAIQTGESVDYLVDSIITGIGRKSVLVMDNLGISAVELQKEIAKVGDFGIASGNIIERELTTMGDVADTTATSIAQLATAWSDLKLAAGDFLINSGLKEFFQDLTTYMKVLQDSDIPLIGWKSPTHENLEEYRKAKEFLAEQQAVNMYSGGESAGGPLENMGKQIETIATLNEQLKLEKENLEQIDTTDRKGLLTQLQVIDALQKRIDQLSKLPETRKANPLIDMLSVPKGFTEASTNSWQKLWDDYAEFQKIQNKLAAAPKSPKLAIEDMTDELMLQNDAINILANGFDSFFSSTENGFRDMMDTIISELQRLLNYYISKAVIFGLIKAFFPESTLVSGGFGKFMGFPGFADGGLAFGPQLAMVGENSSRSNPEVIMPMNKLSQMMGGQIIEVKGTIKGKDIALALRRNG
jgi:hypothetical protein